MTTLLARLAGRILGSFRGTVIRKSSTIEFETSSTHASFDNGLRRAFLLVLVVAITSCSTVGPKPPQTCTPQFPYAEGWLGGDGGYSVPLKDGRSVWLFGDTFVGHPDQRSRTNSKMIHNSIAVSQCSNSGRWVIDYAWGRSDAGESRAFFQPDDEQGYWWLFDGFEHDGALYVGLLRVEPSEPRGPLNLSFRNTGMKLARITNYLLPPDQWRYDVLPLSTSKIAFPGSAMVIDDGFLYLFAFFDRDDTRHRMLARLPLSALATTDAAAALETFASDEGWIPGFVPNQARIVMDDDATEMSVRYHEATEAWFAVYSGLNTSVTEVGRATSDEVQLRTSKRLEGPWSPPHTIFRIPELQGNYAERIDPNLFCYAAKEHPQYASEKELTLTYVCNLLTRANDDPWDTLKRLFSKMDLYRPQVVSVPIPDSVLGAPRESPGDLPRD